MHKVFIDGQVGTTGLQIVQRIKDREDLELVEISQDDRKNATIKREIINSVDIVILCLPDTAARESVSLVENVNVKVLDASTAHRIDPTWIYGLPELDSFQRNKIKEARFVSVPGCYPTGFVLAITPLVKAGIVPADYPVTIQAVSGYSGGGRQLIETYKKRETEQDISKIWAFRPYSLQLSHKHVPEMQFYAGLKHKPFFVPSVGHFHQGMLVMIPLYRHLLKGIDTAKIKEVYQNRYFNESFINVHEVNDMNELDSGFLSPTKCNDTNILDLMVFDNEEQILLIARLDNLGKGASGAAVQNLNLMLQVNESTGLI